MKKTVGKKGFTLIEMIIAVAMLAVAGTAVASLFMNAQINSVKARDLDKSTAFLSSSIEEIKASPENWINGETSLIGSPVVSRGKGSFNIYYDKEWNPMRDESQIQATAEYLVSINLYELPGKDGLWVIDARSVKLKPYFLGNEENVEILKLSTLVSSYGEVAP